jgi:DGQHR domain-containing protein
LTIATVNQLKQWNREKRLNIARLRIIPSGRGRVIRNYQRAPQRGRVTRIRRFLTQTRSTSILKPILPQNIVLNVRKEFKVTRSHDFLVRLPEDLRFNVIDGQHRLEALLELEDDDFPIPITIIKGLNELEEAALFLQINHTQKTVPAEIRLLNIARMRRARRYPGHYFEDLFRVLGFKDVNIEALDVSAEQVLNSGHFFFRRVQLPSTEE